METRDTITHLTAGALIALGVLLASASVQSKTHDYSAYRAKVEQNYESKSVLPTNRTYNQAMRIKTYETRNNLQGTSLDLQRSGLRAITDDIKTIIRK